MPRQPANANVIALAILGAGLMIALAVLYSGGANKAVVNSGKAQEAVQDVPQGGNVPLDNEPALGDTNAKVKIVEFVDYQCAYCRLFVEQTFAELKKAYVDTGKVYFVFKDLPLDFHPQASLAAKTASCANDQGKHLDMHNKLFTGQRDWSGQPGARGVFDGYAQVLGLDMKVFSQCLDSSKYADEISEDIREANSVGIRGTPSFLINGEVFIGAQPFENFQGKIEAALQKAGK